MFVYQTCVTVISLLTIFLYVSSVQGDNDCIEAHYTVENVNSKLEDVRDIKLLKCGRMRRNTVEVSSSSVSASNSNAGSSGATVTVNNNNSSVVNNSSALPSVAFVPQNNGTNATSSNIPVPTTNAANATATSNQTIPANTIPKAQDSASIQTQTSVVMSSSTSVPPTQAPVVNGTVIEKAENKTTGKNPTKIGLMIPVHNLGENGTGIRHITTTCNDTRSNSTTMTNSTACVSEPIVDEEENGTDLNIDEFSKSEEKLFGEHNVTNYKTDYHSYYNSSITTDKKVFDAYWNNVVSKNLTLFDVLSSSHRKAVQHHLKFVFPFYGQPIDVILITTGGFLFTGPNIHFWLSATHYIAPLMANFETARFEDSIIRYYDNGTSLTVVWENMTLNDVPHAGKFTFATTIYVDGNITFAYKNLAMTIEEIPTMYHPVKIGLSDAYEIDNVEFFIRNKLILEYHQIDFKNDTITNNTLIRLIPLPTCPQYNTCKSCLDNDSQFKCSWCSKVQHCSSGLDRLEQEWYIHNCDSNRIEVSSNCSDLDNIPTNRNKYSKDRNSFYGPQNVYDIVGLDHRYGIPNESSTSSGAIIACLLAIIVVGGSIGWVVYAYRNPHTNSGQLLIKYRPSQWSWRRGEARYTAATIHM